MATVAAVRSHFATLGKQALIYGLSGAALQLVGLVTLPVYARYFTAAQYGVLELGNVLRVFGLGIAIVPVGLLTIRPEALELALKAGALVVFVIGLCALGVIGEAENAELRRLAVSLRTRRSAAA
jgi:O-antigen/teichoic acid export membrane protein